MMLRMLDRHEFGVSRRTIERVTKEPPVLDGDDKVERRRRGIGRPPLAEGVRQRLAGEGGRAVLVPEILRRYRVRSGSMLVLTVLALKEEVATVQAQHTTVARLHGRAGGA